VIAQDDGKLNDTWWQEENCEVLGHFYVWLKNRYKTAVRSRPALRIMDKPL